jgi:DNA-binding transcriptional MerR regulator
MHLKVGELARSTGLTVRTLHHYDEIGLLKPSERSEAGYRLYSPQDVARLHGIQALRHLGLPLNDIGALLDGEAAAPRRILEQQMNALEREIAQATELRERLALIRDGLMQGLQPALGDWLQALSLMATYGKYFSAAELKAIFTGWRKIEREWPELMAQVRALMDSGAAIDSPAVQALARQWMSLVHHWMDGDFDLMFRWGEMYRSEPSAHGRGGGPPSDMNAYMQAAIELRMDAMRRHFDLGELRRLRYVPEAEWQAIDAAALKLMREGEPADGPRAKALRAQWVDLLGRLVDGDRALFDKLLAANRSEPLLRTGSPVSPEVRDYLTLALDPHAT